MDTHRCVYMRNAALATGLPGHSQWYCLPICVCLLSRGAPAHAQVFYVVNAAPAEGHHLSLGVIDDEMLSKYLNTEPGSNVLIVSCGPPAFLADVKSVLQETGHAASTLVSSLECIP